MVPVRIAETGERDLARNDLNGAGERHPSGFEQGARRVHVRNADVHDGPAVARLRQAGGKPDFEPGHVGLNMGEAQVVAPFRQRELEDVDVETNGAIQIRHGKLQNDIGLVRDPRPGLRVRRERQHRGGGEQSKCSQSLHAAVWRRGAEGLHQSGAIGRTTMVPPWRTCGWPSASARAASRDGASTMKKPSGGASPPPPAVPTGSASSSSRSPETRRPPRRAYSAHSGNSPTRAASVDAPDVSP
jgi:hypothetical protein